MGPIVSAQSGGQGLQPRLPETSLGRRHGLELAGRSAAPLQAFAKKHNYDPKFLRE